MKPNIEGRNLKKNKFKIKQIVIKRTRTKFDTINKMTRHL